MRRVIPETVQATLAFETMIAPRTPKKTARAKAKVGFDRATKELEPMFERKDFADAQAHHLVALHAHLHATIYEVQEEELGTESFFAACKSAERLLRESFNADPLAAVEYVRWVWSRENKREKQRRAENDQAGGRRIGWRLVFGHRALLTDYRTATARSRPRSR